MTISGLTLENGDGTAVEGGGHHNNGTVTVNSSPCRTHQHSRGEQPVSGGGIYNSGTMTLDLSTVSGIRHSVPYGGGIYNDVAR